MRNTLTNSKTAKTMCLVLKSMTMPGLKDRIYMHREPVVFTDDSYMLQYFLDGHYRSVSWYKGEEGAIPLQARGIIEYYEGIGSKLKMYRKKIIAFTDKYGVPQMSSAEIEFTWEDLKGLYGYELIDLVANHEYEITGRIAGFIPYKPKARVRDMEPRNYAPTPGKSKIVKLKKAA